LDDTAGSVVKLLTLAGVPGGIVQFLGCNERTPAEAANAAEGITLEEALSGLKKTNPQTSWHVAGAVLRVDLSSQVPSILSTRLPHIRLEDAENLVLSMGQLLQTAEVQLAARHSGAELVQPELGFTSLNKDPLMNSTRSDPLELSDVSVEDFLNILAARHSHAIWEISEHSCGSRHTMRFSWLAR
jgi:hypothetical protein